MYLLLSAMLLGAIQITPNVQFDPAAVYSIDVSQEESTLSMWGDPIDSEVDRRFKTACIYNKEEKYEVALEAYIDILYYCWSNNIPLHIDQFDNLLLRIAYCHADMNNAPLALDFYNYRIDVLKNENGWDGYIPQGLKILRDKDEIAIQILLGLCYQDRAVTKTILNDFDGGLGDLELMKNLLKDVKYQDNDYTGKIGDGYFGFIQNSYMLQEWEYVIKGFNAFQACMIEIGKGYSATKTMFALRFTRNAYAQIGNYESARNISAQIIDIIRNNGYSDEYCRDDIKLDGYLKKTK